MAHGKYGRQPRDTSRYAPRFEDYLRPETGGLEPVSNSQDVDRATEVPSWPMYQNDRLGDCTVAGILHALSAMCVYSGQPFPLFSDAEVIKTYSAVSGYDPATGENDNGAQMQDVLRYCRDTGVTDAAGKVHKVVTFAALGRRSDAMLLSQATRTFGVMYVGIDCPASAQTQFGQVWDYVPGSPIEGRHAISLHRRKPYGSQVGVFYYSTWGALQRATLSFNAHYIEEAWAFTSQDWIEANGRSADGFALADLEADMRLVLGSFPGDPRSALLS